jgi:hypothetical protein
MKWFLQFLSLGSAVLYTLLVIIDNRIPDGVADNTVAREAHSNQHRLSAWGPYLPNRSPGQVRQASTTAQPIRQQNPALAPKPYRQSPRQYFDDQPAPGNDGARRKRPASLPITGSSFESSVPLEGKEAIWFVVSRAARLHAGPSVSSRITHFYPVGSELKLVGYEQGWFLVSDPATLRQGWIYEKYYLEAIRGPGQSQLAVQDLPSPTRVALAAPKPKPVSRVKKPRPQQKITKSRPQPSKWIRSPRIHNEFASLIERAFRGY